MCNERASRGTNIMKDDLVMKGGHDERSGDVV